MLMLHQSYSKHHNPTLVTTDEANLELNDRRRKETKGFRHDNHNVDDNEKIRGMKRCQKTECLKGVIQAEEEIQAETPAKNEKKMRIKRKREEEMMLILLLTLLSSSPPPTK